MGNTMSQIKLIAILVTVAFCMPAGTVLQKDVQAQPSENIALATVRPVFGWINETGTGNPVQAAVYFADMDGWGATNSTSSNILGYYSLNLTITNIHHFLMHGINYAYLLNATDVWLDESIPWFHYDMQLEPAPPRNSTVRGNLTDAVTGQFLVNETMTAASGDYINSTKTGANGSFKLGLIPGEYLMGASRTGYESTSIQFTLGVNQSKWRNITLEPLNCTLKGIVRGSGAPLAGAYVFVEEPWNVRPWNNDYENYTDGAGLYKMNLTRGTKSVNFAFDGFLSTSRPATLHAGVNWLNVTLAPEPADSCNVRGYVWDLETTNPIEGAAIRIGNTNNSWTNGTSTDALGFYSVNTVPGDLRIEAEQEYYLRNGTELSLTAGQTRWLNITLTNESAAHAHLQGNITLDGLSVSQGNVNMLTWTDNYGVTTDGSGYYDIEVTAGYTEFAAMTTENGTRSNVEAIDLVLSPGQIMWHDFNLHTLDCDSVILGKVRNQGGTVVEGAFCYFSNAVNGLLTYETAAVSDFNGTYEISLPRNERAAYLYLADGYRMQSGEITPDQEWNWRNITLQSVGATATVKGYFTDLDGTPIIGHQMMVTATDWMNWTETDSDGFFSIKVPRGDIYISPQLDSYYDPGRLLAKTGAGGTIWMNISARPKPLIFEVVGSVRGSNSTAVPGADITAMFNDRKFTAMSDAAGNYTLMVPQGRFDIAPHRSGYGTGNVYSMQTNSWLGSLYWTNLTLDGSAAWLESPVADTVRDDDSDGKSDWLFVDVKVNVSVSGGYALEGSLFANEWSVNSGGISSGRAASARNETQLETGLRTVRLAFNGPQLSLSGIDGYAVDLRLHDSGWTVLDSTVVQLTPRNSTDFDVPDIEPASPWHSFGPVDTDFDGLYNMLLFNTTVEVLAEGNYTVMAQLYNVPGIQSGGDMTELDSEMETRHMAAGTYKFDFAFSGTAIYNSHWHLGLASVILFNSSVALDETTTIGASQAYVPYDYRQFQNYPIDAMVYGWANDTGNAAIENLRVEIYNTTNRYLNFTYTDANGYYELGGWGGSWILVMNDDDETSHAYQGNLTTITLTAGLPIKRDRIMQEEILDTNALSILFRQDDWNRTAVESVMGMLNDNQTIRYDFDVYEFGNGDGFISEAEVDMLMGFLGAQVDMPANLTDHMTLDGITYDLDGNSTIYDIGLVGQVTSAEPIYIRQKANYTAQTSIPAGSPHWLNINLSYDDTDMDSMSEVNSTMICHVIPPTNWGMTGNKPTVNITFSGTDYITADPGTDPDPGDAFEYEWANITISDSQVPTVGTIAGNVTLDGRTSHFGVTVKVTAYATGSLVATTATDTYGFYSVSNIAPGNYNITAEKAGYQSNATNNHAVSAGTTTWIANMTLFSYPPVIFNVQYMSTVTNYTAIEVYADVTDDGVVGDVVLMYSDVFGSNYALPMSKLGGTTYKAVIPAQTGTGTVYFHITANDTTGRSARLPAAGEFAVTVIEVAPPVLSNLAVTQNPTEYGDSTNVTVTVVDASAITGVWLYNHFTSTNTSMGSAGAGNYYLEDTFLTLGLYQFTIWAIDSFGNFNYIDGSFTVQDSTAPAISGMTVNPQTPEYLGAVNISANITDLAGITGAWLDARYPNGTALGNITMTHGTADSYFASFTCDMAGHYSFTIWARDVHGQSSSSAGSFWANDTVKPTIRNLTAPASVELGQEVNITADIDDLGGLDNVTLQMFGPNNQEIFNETMNGGSYWYVFVPDSPGQYTFTIWALDGNGVVNSTSSTFMVIDTTPPNFVSVNVIPQVQEVHGSVNVRAIIDDTDSVFSCYLNLTAPDGHWLSNASMSLSGNIFNLNRTYALLGDYSFTLWARDPSGNFNHYSGTIPTEDTQVPVANAGIDRTVQVGTNVAFNASASTDNYGIANYTWTLTDNGVQTLYGLAIEYRFTSVGVYDVTLQVTDYAGLTSTDLRVITVTGVLTTGMVTGTVLDSEGNPIPGVTVYIDNTAPRVQTTTDNTGYFILEGVPQGNQTIWFVRDGYERTSRTVSVTAGSTVSAGTITLDPSGGFSACALLILMAIIIVPVIVYVLYKKRKAAKKASETVIDEIFYMSTDGRLIKHFTRRLKPDMDQDILSGMLVAVQDFIKDSFRGEEGGLEELKFGKFQIVLGRGKHTIIAALILGDDTKPFKPQIEKCLKDIETNHHEALETWDGEVDKLTPSFRHINDLIAGKYA